VNYTISASAGSNGRISPSGSVSVARGGSQTFSMSPNSGYQIADIRVNGNSVGSAPTYTFRNVTANQSIRVTFEDRTANHAPNRPELLLPANDGRIDTVTPLLEIAEFSDPDDTDDHGATRWQIASDPGFSRLVLDIVSDTQTKNNYLLSLLVSQGILFDNQTYYWRARVSDARGAEAMWSEWSETFRFVTEALQPADVNSNGVPDSLEPQASDLDGNGIDDRNQPEMRVLVKPETAPLKEVYNYQQRMVGIRAGAGVSDIEAFSYIDPEDLPEDEKPASLPYGLINFNVLLDQVGGTVEMEIFLSGGNEEGFAWHKYDPVKGWYAFPVRYENGRYLVRLTDGGAGDCDGTANGIIVDPIGVSALDAGSGANGDADASGGGGGGGGGSCFIGAAGHHDSAVALWWLTVLLFGLAVFCARLGFPKTSREVLRAVDRTEKQSGRRKNGS
jgi:hypothetical protein